MRIRKPIIRRSLCAAALGLAAGAGWMQPARLLAQPPAATTNPPTLPETKVEANPPSTTPSTNPPPPNTGQNPFDQGQGPGNGQGTGQGTGAGSAPVSAGGLFGSTPADGYRATTSTTATLIDAPNLNIPAAVDVVPNALFTDQQATRFVDILRDIPSATFLGDTHMPDSITLRGFEVTNHDYRWNGFFDPSFAPRDVANVDRFEILKGPASSLYGYGQPSGVVNLITKKPQADEAVNFDVQFGNYGLVRPTVDATGALDDEGRLLFRINAAYQDQDSFRDFGFDERTFVAPAFTWVIADDTALTIEGSYLNDREHFDTGVTALNGAIDPIPISRSLNEPTDFNRYWDYKASAVLTHRFEGDWTGRLGVFGTWYGNDSMVAAPVLNLGVPLAPGTPPLAPAGTVAREEEAIPTNNEQYYSIVGDLGGTVTTGSIQHKAVVGTELGFYTTQFGALTSDPLPLVQTPFFPFPLPIPSSPININSPMYGGPTPALPGSDTAFINQQRYGFYAEDLADWNGVVQVLAGVRGDVVSTDFTRSQVAVFGGQNIDSFGPITTDEMDYRTTPRIGLVVQPVKDVLSLYTTYSLSFDPPTGAIFANPTPLRPETGQIIEGGFKADLLDKHLTVTADGYYIVKNNVVTQESVLFATQIGEQRSQGCEVSATGKLTDEWSIVANYAYTDSRILKDDDPTLVGTRFRGVPYNNFNVWTRYDVIHTKSETLGAGLGMVLETGREGDLANTFELPGFTRWDAGLFWRQGMLHASLYFENIFDRKYYAGSVDQFTVFPGEPFTFRGTIGLTF